MLRDGKCLRLHDLVRLLPSDNTQWPNKASRPIRQHNPTDWQLDTCTVEPIK